VCLSQQGAEVADLQLLCADLRAEAAAARTEAAVARAEVQRQRSELVQVVEERDRSRGRAAKAESRADTLAADLAVAQAATSEQRARAGGKP
jgi:DNA recombination protein RmuC